MINLMNRLGQVAQVYKLREYYISIKTDDHKKYPEFADGFAPDGLPLPPAILRTKVAGGSRVNWFYDSGKMGRESIETALSRNDFSLNNFKSILDFGCGCGRVIRHLHDLSSAQIYGTDYSPRLVDWCKDNLAFATFSTNMLFPPLPFEAEQFDLIYAFSVFTHLDAENHILWRDELIRVTKPGGILLISTMNRSHLEQHSKSAIEDLAKFDQGELVIRFNNVQGTNLCGAYHPEVYIRDVFAKNLKVLDFIPMGATGNGSQDLYVFQVPLS